MAAAPEIRLAHPQDAATVAALLHAFNEEYGWPTPGSEVLARRLADRLVGDGLAALLAGDDPGAGVALVSFRPNVWFDGPVALLDELYVRPELRGRGIGKALLDAACALVRERGGELLEINVDEGDADARRFYEREGFSAVEPETGEPALYYFREL